MSPLRGLAYPLRGARLVYLEHPGLVRVWLVPILLTFVALGGAVWGALALHGPIMEMVWSAPAGEGLLATVGRATHGLLSVLVLGVLLLGGAVLVVAMAHVIAAPFNDLLSEKVEELRTGRQGPPFSWGALLRDVVRTVGLEVVKLLLWAVVMLPLFLLSLLVPGVGQVAYGLFGFVFTALYFALDYVDWPASRRGRSVRDRLAFLRAHRGVLLGFGVGVWALLLVPLLNLFFMPAAVAGGTLLYLDVEGFESEGQGRRPSPDGTGESPVDGAA